MKKALGLIFASLVMFASTASYAGGDAEKGKALAASCAACHGSEGVSTNPDWPNLAGQGAGYLAKQLYDFRTDKRINAVMNGMAKAIASDDDVEHIAAYYASLPAGLGEAKEEMVEEGSLLYKGGKTSTKIAACASCHGPTGSGVDSAKFPMLAGQHSKYIAAQLKAFRSGERANDMNQMMRDVAKRMSDTDIEKVAGYISGLQD
ncbi:MAG: c-type cytochrome [Leucothrix sp.]